MGVGQYVRVYQAKAIKLYVPIGFGDVRISSTWLHVDSRYPDTGRPRWRGFVITSVRKMEFSTQGCSYNIL
jgi:hypothetical protein